MCGEYDGCGAFLKQVEKIDAKIKNKLVEQQQWRDIALSVTANMSGEKVQSSGSQSKMAEAIDKCVDMEAELDAYAKQLKEQRDMWMEKADELKAEIDRLKADHTRVCAERDARICTYNFAKAEAIKEFEDKIKDKFDKHGVDYTAYVIVDDVSKEVVGEDNNSPIVDNQN